jgi:peptide methionine sulfoxide reductase MsrB
MPNRIRPRCPTCNSPMGPIFRKGPRGKAFVRVPDSFYCVEHNKLARGRKKTAYL